MSTNDTNPEPNEETPNEKLLKSHLALATQMLEAICDANDVDLDGTSITVTVGEQSASLSVSKMIAQWKEMTK